MGDWIGDERRRRGPSFSSALLEAISRATESSQDELSLPNKPKLRKDDYASAEHLSFKYNSINALQVRTGSSAGDRRHCCCGSSSCKWRNAQTSTSISNPRPAYAPQGAEMMPKVKEPSPKLKPSKAVSPGSRLASILNSVLVSSWSKSKSQRQELKPVSDCASNSASSSHSLFARSTSSTSSSSSLHKPKSMDHYQHVARTSPSYHTNYKSSSSSTSTTIPPSYHTNHKSSSSSTSTTIPPSYCTNGHKSSSYHKSSSSSTSTTIPPSYHTNHKSSSSSTSTTIPPSYHTNHKSSSTSTSTTISPSYHIKHQSSSSSTSTASANKQKNGKIRRWVMFEKNSSVRNYSTKVDNSRNLDDQYADSDSSSDLFELNSIYSRDLPVYETTHLETNKAIAKGLL